MIQFEANENLSFYSTLESSLGQGFRDIDIKGSISLKAEIDHVRGVDCSAVLRLLLDRELAQIVGRKEEPGRPHLYGTTVKFLEFFNLKGLRELPDLREFRELNEESQATLRDKLGDEVDDEAEVMGQEVIEFDADSDELVDVGTADESGASDADADA